MSRLKTLSGISVEKSLIRSRASHAPECDCPQCGLTEQGNGSMQRSFHSSRYAASESGDAGVCESLPATSLQSALLRSDCDFSFITHDDPRSRIAKSYSGHFDWLREIRSCALYEYARESAFILDANSEMAAVDRLYETYSALTRSPRDGKLPSLESQEGAKKAYYEGLSEWDRKYGMVNKTRLPSPFGGRIPIDESWSYVKRWKDLPKEIRESFVKQVHSPVVEICRGRDLKRMNSAYEQQVADWNAKPPAPGTPDYFMGPDYTLTPLLRQSGRETFVFTVDWSAPKTELQRAIGKMYDASRENKGRS